MHVFTRDKLARDKWQRTVRGVLFLATAGVSKENIGSLRLKEVRR